jgi:hypothetical protein
MTIRERLAMQGVIIPPRKTSVIKKESSQFRLDGLLKQESSKKGLYEQSNQYNAAKSALERMGL